MNNIKTNIKPFLRWAGGKSWLKNQILELIENLIFNNYHEPFLGGGSTYFNIKPEGQSFLSDTNSKLINTYNAIKDDYNKVIVALKKFQNKEKEYYKIRGKEFECSWEQAAQFIYLNQTSFNGIYRENLNGKYNVPYGYRTKEIFNESHLREISEILQCAKIFTSDFENTIENIKGGDLVFIDPPYTVSHNLNGFIKYNKKLFSINDQLRLKDYIEEINKKGAYYILTNAAHKTIFDIFDNDYSELIELSRCSLIGGKNAKRDVINEYLFTNIL